MSKRARKAEKRWRREQADRDYWRHMLAIDGPEPPPDSGFIKLSGGTLEVETVRSAVFYDKDGRIITARGGKMVTLPMHPVGSPIPATGGYFYASPGAWDDVDHEALAHANDDLIANSTDDDYSDEPRMESDARLAVRVKRL